MRRRRYLRRAVTLVGAAGLAGCAERGTVESSGRTLRVATYPSFTGPETAGSWLKEAFEAAEKDVTVEYTTPENRLNQYVERVNAGESIDADMYVGFTIDELLSAERTFDEPIFENVENDVYGTSRITDGLEIDPSGRAIPFATNYVELVYNADKVANPKTFGALLDPAYENGLLVQDPRTSDVGRAFLLWTIHAKGEDGYLDYWQRLVDNGVTIRSGSHSAYDAYLDGDAPMVVSSATDQVSSNGGGVNMAKHQLSYLEHQGYTDPEAMAEFRDADEPELARLFMAFILSGEGQPEIAARNVQFPAVEGIDPGPELTEYASTPPEPVMFSHDALAGNLRPWIDDWTRQFVGE